MKPSSLHLAIVRSRERASVIFQLNNRLWCLSCHVVDGILISKPIRTLDRVVHVPPPIVLVHVSEGRINSSLSCYSVTSSWKELGYTRCVKTSLGKTKSCPQTSPTGSNDNGIIFVVLLNSIRDVRFLIAQLYIQRRDIGCRGRVRLLLLGVARV